MKVPNIFEREAIQLGYTLPEEPYLMFKQGLLQDIKIVQTNLAPEDAIYVHPSIVGRMLNNSKNMNGYIDIIKKGSNE